MSLPRFWSLISVQDFGEALFERHIGRNALATLKAQFQTFDRADCGKGTEPQNAGLLRFGDPLRHASPYHIGAWI